MELQVWHTLGLAELLRKQVNGAGERALGKGDKSIRKPIFIRSLMILQEKPDEGGGGGLEGFHYWAWREARAALNFGWLEGCVIRHLMRGNKGVTEHCPGLSWEHTCLPGVKNADKMSPGPARCSCWTLRRVFLPSASQTLAQREL